MVYQDRSQTRERIGIAVGTALSVVFGSGLSAAGCFYEWKTDTVFQAFTGNGIGFRNITPSDGLLVLVLTALAAASLIAGAAFRNRRLSLLSLLCYSLVLLVSALGIMAFRKFPPLLSPGKGLLMVLGGGVAGFLCSSSVHSMLKGE